VETAFTATTIALNVAFQPDCISKIKKYKINKHNNSHSILN